MPHARATVLVGVNRCAEWVAKKGCATDCMAQRTGQRPRGNITGEWRAKPQSEEVKPGDQVFVATRGCGQRAELVAEVVGNAEGAIATGSGPRR